MAAAAEVDAGRELEVVMLTTEEVLACVQDELTGATELEDE